MSPIYIFYIIIGVLLIAWVVLHARLGFRLGYFKLDFLKKLNWKGLWNSLQEYKIPDKIKDLISKGNKK